MFEIRCAQPSDHPEIVQLWHQGWHDAHEQLVPEGVLEYRTPKHFWKWLKCSNDTFWVAIDDDVIGFIATNAAELTKLYVKVNARGTGVAKALLLHGERQIRGNGFREAEIFCTAGNSRAEKFYSREGWVLNRTFQDQLWSPETTSHQFTVETHRYHKSFTSTAVF